MLHAGAFRMNRNYCQFSIRTLFAFTIVTAVLVSMRDGVRSERSLQAIWVASLLFSYWNSPPSPWRRIGRVTAVTGIVWSVCILWAYRLYAAGIDIPLKGLVLRGVLVALAGIVIAFTAACWVEGLGSVGRFWSRASTPRRVLCAGLLLLPLFAWAVRDAACSRYWDPAAVISASQTDGDMDPVHRAEQKHGVKFMHTVGSADGVYLAAILNGSQDALILDCATNGVAAKLATAGIEWFGDLTFLPNSRVLAAIVYSGATPVKLLRWDAPHWTPRDPVSLDGLATGSKDGDNTFLSLDQILLVVNGDRIGERRAKVKIWSIDLLQDRLNPRTFATAVIDMQLPRDGHAWTGASNAWVTSAKGTWIASSGSWVQARPDYLFSAQRAPTRLAGCAIGFLSDDDRLAIYERYEGLVWKNEPVMASAPPFWNHLVIGMRFRVVIFDCRSRQVVARSRWYTRLREPRITPDRSRLLAEREDTVLVWQTRPEN